MADILNKIRIGVSPLTKRIMLYRMGKSTTDALESLDVTGPVYGAVIEHMMDGAPEGKGMKTTITSGQKAWSVTVKPVFGSEPSVNMEKYNAMKELLQELYNEPMSSDLSGFQTRLDDVLSMVKAVD